MKSYATQAWTYLIAAVSVLAKWFVISLLAQLALTAAVVGLLAGPGLVSAGFSAVGAPTVATVPVAFVTFVGSLLALGVAVSRVDPIFGFTAGIFNSD